MVLVEQYLLLTKGLFFAAVLLLLGCQGKEEPTFPVTTTDDGITYKNEYFGLAVKKPTTWVIIPDKDVLGLQNIGEQLLYGNNAVNKHEYTDIKLFMFAEKGKNKLSRYNARVFAIAESLQGRQIETSCDYLSMFGTHMIKRRPPGYTVDGFRKCEEATISSRSFGLLTGTIRGSVITHHHDIYAYIHGNHIISIVAIYSKIVVVGGVLQ